MQNALNNALLYTAARFKVDDILYGDVAGFREAVQERVSDLADQEQLGITIEQCQRGEHAAAAVAGRFRPGHHRAPKPEQGSERREQLRKPDHQQCRRAGVDHHQPRPQPHSTLRRSPSRPTPKRFSDLLPKYEDQSQSVRAANTGAETMAQVLTNVEDKIYLPTTRRWQTASN